MKISRFLIAATVAALLAPGVAYAADYRLDPSHTAVTFHISHFGFSSPSGKFMNVDGRLLLDEKNPAASQVSVTIPVDKIDTGVPALDEHLKSDQFFNTAKFPTATFASKKVEITSPNTASVTGDLTLHGVTKPVTLAVKLNKIGDSFMHVPTAGFTATTTLKRSDFGMTAYAPGLGDVVQIDIESEANLAAATTAK